MKKILLFFLLALFILSVKAVSKCTFKTTNRSMKASTKSYTPKAPYSGFGKKSSVNNQIKTKPVSGYFKPSNGYKFVNSYSRSK